MRDKIVMTLMVVILASFMLGCDALPTTIQKSETPDPNYRFQNIVVIDECEYIKEGYYIYIHRGQCKYCQERQRVMIEALIKTNMIQK